MTHNYLLLNRFIAVLTIASIWCQPSFADDVAGSDGLPSILSHGTIKRETYLPDFSYAGYHNGAEELPVASGTIILVDDFGAVADDDKDDTRAVLAALSAAHSAEGPVVLRFSSGRYRITAVLKIERSNIVLQGHGSGPDGTTLWFPRPLTQVDKSSSLDELRKYIVDLDKRQREPDKNLDEYFSEYSWSGGFLWIQKPGTRAAAYLEEYDPSIEPLAEVVSGKRGLNTLSVTDASGISVGDIVQVQWLNREGPDAGIIRSLYGSASATAGSHHWTFPNRPLVRQTSRVIAIDDTTLSLADPLLHDVNEDIPAQIADWEGLEEVGIEDLHLEFPNAPWFGHHMEQGYNGIYFTSAYDSWARNIRTTNADSGILSYNSANLTYLDITTDGERKAHYGVHMGNVHNVLAQNVKVLNPVLHSLTFNTQSTKCVYKDAEVFVTPILDQHAGSNHQNLFDNVTLHTRATASEDGPVAVVFDGSGAGYWQPGHGAFNTTWNLRVLINGGAYADESVTILGTDEGPMARIVGLHGNRTFELDYRPAPYVEALNVALSAVPSLYDYQLRKRLDNN
ncbi:MAG: glycoside hydrolase family 55 protein [Gammaproteobacteria bacterium]|nr:glycoside hydrolase family 55 protein [Gammaproteobacteria bacterium]